MIQLFGIGIIAIILFFAQQKIYRKLWDRGLRVDVAFAAESIYEGQQGILREYVENRKRLPLAMIKVKFQTSRNLVFDAEVGSRTTDRYYRNDVFQIGGGERVTRTLKFTGGRRGFYSIENVDLVASDLFMTTEMNAMVKLYRTIYVLPRFFDSREFRLSLQQLNGEVLVNRHHLEDPFEYRGIREYQVYDDMRLINWKATAKTGEFKVNQRGYTALQTIRIFLNLEDSGILKKAECVEASIQIAAGLCEFFLQQGIQVACYSGSKDIVTGKPLFIEAGAGKGRMINILKSLARLDTDKEPENFRALFEEKLLKEAQGTFTCVVAPNQYGDFVELMEEFQESGRAFVWFYPVWEPVDPEVPQTLQKNIRILHVRS